MSSIIDELRKLQGTTQAEHPVVADPAAPPHAAAPRPQRPRLLACHTSWWPLTGFILAFALGALSLYFALRAFDSSSAPEPLAARQTLGAEGLTPTQSRTTTVPTPAASQASASSPSSAGHLPAPVEHKSPTLPASATAPDSLGLTSHATADPGLASRAERPVEHLPLDWSRLPAILSPRAGPPEQHPSRLTPPPEPASPEERLAKRQIVEQLKIDWIFGSENRFTVSIAGSEYREGDHIEELRLDEIGPDYIVFSFKNVRLKRCVQE